MNLGSAVFQVNIRRKGYCISKNKYSIYENFIGTGDFIFMEKLEFLQSVFINKMLLKSMYINCKIFVANLVVK